jgi:putative DNA primase/helicase
MRPVILTRIEEVATRSDLLDRAMLLTLPRISDDRRLPESEFWQRFNEAAPRILGSLLDAVVVAMNNLDTTHLSRLPRMADFALWVTAGERTLGLKPEEFLQAYMGNREASNELALEASPIAKPVLEFMKDKAPWKGSSKELLDSLSELVDDKTRNQNSWPKAGNVLTNKLKRLERSW